MSNTIYAAELANTRTADLIAAAEAHRQAKDARRANRIKKYTSGHSDPSRETQGDTTVL